MKKKIYKLFLAIILFFNFAAASLEKIANKNFADRQEVKDFINYMHEKHKSDRHKLAELFKKYHTNQDVLYKIAHPSEKLSWGKYKKLLISTDRINNGKKFLLQHQQDLLKAEQRFGVPKEIIVAILGVESFYGVRAGSIPVIESLATLAFDYPPRHKFFRQELEQFLLLIEEEKLDPENIKGSYAGAMSPAQFISSSYRTYAIDFANIGSKDLNNITNAIGSIANYFAKHGWQKDQPIAVKAKMPVSNNAYPKASLMEFINEKNNKEYWLGFNNFIVITKYNHSVNYAMAVYQLAISLGLGSDLRKI